VCTGEAGTPVVVLEVSVEQRESWKADECVGEHEAFSTVLHAKWVVVNFVGWAKLLHAHLSALHE
jgi:hypothetical protein